MTCVFHPDRPEAGACEGCRRLVCEECRVPYEGRSLCPVCRRRAAAGALGPGQPVAHHATDAGRQSGDLAALARPTRERPREPDRLFERWRLLLAQPGRLFASLSDSPRAADWGFFLSSAWPAAALIVVWRLSFPSLLRGRLLPPRYLGMAVVLTLLAPILLVAIALFCGAVNHLTLLVLGERRASFSGTQRVALHALAAHYLVGWVPFVGALVGLIWSTVLATIGLRAMHHVNTGRAAVAALMPVLICCGAAAFILVYPLAVMTALR